MRIYLTHIHACKLNKNMGKLLCALAHIIIYDSKMIMVMHITFLCSFSVQTSCDISDSENEECEIPEFGTVPTQNYAAKALLLQSNTVAQRIELLLNTDYVRTIMEERSSPYTLKP